MKKRKISQQAQVSFFQALEPVIRFFLGILLWVGLSLAVLKIIEYSQYSHLLPIENMFIIGELNQENDLTFQALDLSAVLPIKTLLFAGQLKNISIEDLAKVLLPHIQKGFLHADLESIQTDLLAEGWFESVLVQRYWPLGLQIQLIERQPIAHWGEELLVDQSLETFSVRKEDQLLDHLPILFSTREEAALLWQQYLDINQLIKNDLNTEVVKLLEDKRGALKVFLTNGLELKLGMSAHQERLKRLISVYNQTIKDKESEVLYIDLRYRNGFSVRWKSSN